MHYIFRANFVFVVVTLICSKAFGVEVGNSSQNLLADIISKNSLIIKLQVNRVLGPELLRKYKDLKNPQTIDVEITTKSGNWIIDYKHEIPGGISHRFIYSKNDSTYFRYSEVSGELFIMPSIDATLSDLITRLEFLLKPIETFTLSQGKSNRVVFSRDSLAWLDGKQKTSKEPKATIFWAGSAQGWLDNVDWHVNYNDINLYPSSVKVIDKSGADLYSYKVKKSKLYDIAGVQFLLPAEATSRSYRDGIVQYIDNIKYGYETSDKNINDVDNYITNATYIYDMVNDLQIDLNTE